MDRLAAMTTFVAVVETGSFTRAAEMLLLPNARVSQRVSDLERHLGLRLLSRTTRALSLTEDGQAYFARCQQILQDINDLEEALKHGRVNPQGRLRVDALVSVSRWLIAPHLHEFQAKYPQVSVRLGSSDRIRNMLEEGIDCSIRGGELDTSNHIARHLGDVRLGLYAAPAYLHKNCAQTLTHPAELEQLQRISWFTSQRNPLVWSLESGSDTVELPRQEDHGLYFEDPDVAIAACMAGAGVSPSAPFAVEAWVRAGQLVPVLPQWSFKARSINIIYPSNKHLSARVRCFVDWVLELIHSSQSVGMTPAELAARYANSD